MNKQEAEQKIREILQRITPSIEVYRQDAEIEGSVIKIERLGKKIEIAIANASDEDQSTSQFF